MNGRGCLLSFGRINTFFSRLHNRLPRAVLVQLCREARGVWLKRGIHRLVVARRKISLEIRRGWPWLTVNVSCHVESLLIG